MKVGCDSHKADDVTDAAENIFGRWSALLRLSQHFHYRMDDVGLIAALASLLLSIYMDVYVFHP